MSTVTFSKLKTPRSLVILAIFLAVVIGVGGLIGTATTPGAWYASLEKPVFTPPNWLFVPYAAWVGYASLLNLTIALLN